MFWNNKYIQTLEKENASLALELKQAQNLKSVLEKLADKSNIIWGQNLVFSEGTVSASFNLPDDVPRYVDDYCGGKVFKQEATKVVELDAEGNAKYFYTKKEADKGFNYKLIRK